MEKIDSVIDFLNLHMQNQLQDNEVVRLIAGYKGSIAMYNHLNQAQKGLSSALKDRKPVDIVWIEAARLALWLARIADLYEKEIDRMKEAEGEVDMAKLKQPLPKEGRGERPTSPRPDIRKIIKNEKVRNLQSIQSIILRITRGVKWWK